MAPPSKVIAAVFAAVCVPALCGLAAPAHAWGDEGHEIIGLIADHYLTPVAREKLNALLATDTSALTALSGVRGDTRSRRGCRVYSPAASTIPIRGDDDGDDLRARKIAEMNRS